MGQWGEELGKSIEVWGEQLGRRAEEWGNDVRRRAEQWGDEVGRRAEQWGDGMASRAGASGASWHRPQETGVQREKSGEANMQADPQTTKATKTPQAADDDDASFVLSDSDSDSSSEADSDDDDASSAASEKRFLSRLHAINRAAASSRTQGTKPAHDVELKPARAIAHAVARKTALSAKIELKRAKRGASRELGRKRREIRREHGLVRVELRTRGLGKGSWEWEEARGVFREKKEALRREGEGGSGGGRRAGRADGMDW